MPDPFLLAHRVYDYFFDIGGNISPISIRDQMVRGRTIIERALEEGLLDSDHPLLVIGAGAAGATAAIHAAKFGIRTTLIDLESAPFSRQRASRSRWVDPTQYDWSVSHWKESVYPWTVPRMPLRWRKNFASYLAAGWTRELNRIRKKYSILDVRYNTTLTWQSPSSSGRGVEVQFNNSHIIHRYGMVVSSIGFGTERCTVGNYSAFKFWDTDDFEKPRMGLPHLNSIRVMISGGGDGALQDFLRISTREPIHYAYDKSAKDIYEKLRESVRSLSHPKAADIMFRWGVVENEIQSAEDQAQRAYIWGERQHDHAINVKLHRAHEAAIETLWKLWKGEAAVWSVIRHEILNLLRRPMPEVKLVYPCTHFSRCYGLNRFLVLLLAKFIKEEQSVTTLLSGHQVFNISGHACNHNPRVCYGQNHEVYLRAAVCNSKPSGPVWLHPKPYNVVVIRHGVHPPRSTTITFPRQILPYHVTS